MICKRAVNDLQNLLKNAQSKEPPVTHHHEQRAHNVDLLNSLYQWSEYGPTIKDIRYQEEQELRGPVTKMVAKLHSIMPEDASSSAPAFFSSPIGRAQTESEERLWQALNAATSGGRLVDTAKVKQILDYAALRAMPYITSAEVGRQPSLLGGFNALTGKLIIDPDVMATPKGTAVIAHELGHSLDTLMAKSIFDYFGLQGDEDQPYVMVRDPRLASMVTIWRTINEIGANTFAAAVLDYYNNKLTWPVVMAVSAGWLPEPDWPEWKALKEAVPDFPISKKFVPPSLAVLGYSGTIPDRWLAQHWISWYPERANTYKKVKEFMDKFGNDRPRGGLGRLLDPIIRALGSRAQKSLTPESK
mgnify:CR=1 FL=1